MADGAAHVADVVSHPPHYQGAGGLDAIDVIETYGLHVSMHLGNAAKYMLRAGRKDGAGAGTDLRKALWYVRRWNERGDWRVYARHAMADVGPRPSPEQVLTAFGLTLWRADAMRALLGLREVVMGSWQGREAHVAWLIETLERAALEATASDAQASAGRPA